jgi:uncharacterized RmlC-like cupin family protein
LGQFLAVIPPDTPHCPSNRPSAVLATVLAKC